MPALLVHGVPETAAVWDGVREQLDDLAPRALALPGFGSPAPEGFDASKESYLAWLTGEVEAAGEPVDLVGHDWGGILTARLALTRPELIRTWVTDAIAIFDPAAQWHDLAKLWQTPQAGEEFMANMEAMEQDQRAALLAGAGMPESYAQVAAEPDPEMNRSILALYRSAMDVSGDWGEDLEPTQRPGLMVVATGDAFASTDLATAQSERLGLTVHELDGLGHWWLVQDPERAAGMLREYWASAA